MKRIALIATLALIVATTSCKTAQIGSTSSQRDMVVGSTTRTLSKENQLYSSMLDSYAQWDDFVAKGNISVGNMSSSFEMRMIQNEGIQISLRPALGIEVARIIITQDEVIMYEKMGRRYISGSMESLKQRLPFDVTLEDLQNIFLGRPFIIGSGSVTAQDYKNFRIEVDGEEWTMTPIKQYDNLSYNFSLNGAQLTSSQAGDEASQSEIKCSYSNIQEINNTLTPKTVKVDFVNKKESMSCTIKYNTVKWNSGTKIEKLSTARYTRISVEDAKKMLKK